MNLNSLLAPDNNAAEMRDFENTCRQLQGFEAQLNAEFVDGFLSAVAAGPRPLPADAWLPVLAGDTFDRVFADPLSRAQALGALQTRLSVLRGQLDPEALADRPDAMRLNPWMSEWTDDDRQQVLAEEGGALEDGAVAMLQTGAVWAVGFLAAVDGLPQLWTLPTDEEPQQLFADALDQVLLLSLPVDGDEWKALIAGHYPDGAPSRDDLIAEACMAIQDLRLWWVDFAPKPDTRRVEVAPGRNDPCPCGSGKKFKRCHGAATA